MTKTVPTDDVRPWGHPYDKPSSEWQFTLLADHVSADIKLFNVIRSSDALEASVDTGLRVDLHGEVVRGDPIRGLPIHIEMRASDAPPYQSAEERHALLGTLRYYKTEEPRPELGFPGLDAHIGCELSLPAAALNDLWADLRAVWSHPTRHTSVHLKVLGLDHNWTRKGALSVVSVTYGLGAHVVSGRGLSAEHVTDRDTVERHFNQISANVRYMVDECRQIRSEARERGLSTRVLLWLGVALLAAICSRLW